MSSLRTSMLFVLALCAVARADSDTWPFGPHQVEVVESATDLVAATRPAPRVLSSTFLENAWGARGYVPSPDGRTLLVVQPGGLRVVRDGVARDVPLRLVATHQELVWHPDSRRVALWVEETPPPRPGYVAIVQQVLALLDVTRLPAEGEPTPYEVVHRRHPTQTSWQVEWSHDGQALLVAATELDPESNDAHGVVTRVPLTGADATRELLRVRGPLDFVLGPASAAPVSTSTRLVVGHAEGLFVTDERGRDLTRLADLPPARLHAVAWSPDRRRDQLLLHYRRAARSASGATFQGIYLVDLDGGPRSATRVDEAPEGGDAGFSPRGTWVAWSTPTGVWLRAPGGEPADAVLVSIPPRADGQVPEVRGFAWSADEAKLAITAGNKLYIYELANQALYPVLERGRFEDTFLAEPTWVGDRVVVTVYTSPFRGWPGEPAGRRPKGC